MLNSCQIIGFLGADPESRTTQGGAGVVTLSVATSEKWKGKDGNMQEATEWHRVICWNKLADTCAQYLHKGSKVYVEGRIQTREWEKDGVKRWTTELIARRVLFLDPKGEGGATGRRETPPVDDDSDNFPF